MDKANVYTKLLKVQAELKAPKNKYSKYGGYNYRSLEGILEALKPLLSEVGAVVLLSDKVEEKAGRWYIVASAAFIDAATGESVRVEARARETAARAKFDDAQLTGAASSYARKYALSGLFGVDDGADVDGLPDSESVGRASGKKKGGENAGASQSASASSARAEQTKAPAPELEPRQTKAPSPAPEPRQTRTPEPAEQQAAASGGRNTQAQAESVEMINAVQCQLLEKEAKRKGVELAAVCQRYKVANVMELLEKDYRAIMQELHKVKAAG